MKTYTVKIQTNEKEEPFIELPDEVISELDIKEGTVFEWLENKDGSFTLQKKQDTVWVLVEAVNQFRTRYMVEVPKNNPSWALDTVVCEEAVEFSQKHLGETIVSHRIVTEEQALYLCREDNDYISGWEDKKLKETFFTMQKSEDPT